MDRLLLGRWIRFADRGRPTLRRFDGIQFASQVGRRLLESFPIGVGIHRPREPLRAGDLLQ
ncbi:hypothetical protein IVB56_09735 [Bradyrhizobium sp. CW7]|uniref:hypothetical protein n=1 Tax=Bradyrhizobium sp. CW7 TaxID=2782688 RepID=UPI001FFB3AD8|nr:hypothetical protein [Bradyrhizobium sp. CW7]MCK1351386.1 hypothetical protein [Bradyrhizobium sp. CW7]